LGSACYAAQHLGKPLNRVRQGDIHITNLWGLEGQTAPSWANQIHSQAQPLWTKYEEQADRISRYLQHCTTQRVQAKDWLIDEMNNEIEPLLSQIGQALQPTNQLLEAVPAVQILTPHTASTAVATPTAVMPILLSNCTNSTTS
jgi:hypothetical protein